MTEQQEGIQSKTLEELQTLFTTLGEKPFRAKQLYQWLHQRLARDYDSMTNLPAALRARLARDYPLTILSPAHTQVSRIDGTTKYLFVLPDGNMIESVLMKYKHGNSVCISSQAGCRMGCTFCASAIGGLSRSLTPAEMLEQIYQIQLLSGERVHNVVVMGTGEPLDNYENLLRFLQILTGTEGLNISQRNITVSTCGLAPQIRALAKEKLQITLALSLHAPNQEKREKLMPVARKYPLFEVLDACRYYFEHTGRRLTFEYSLAAGINDSDEDARQLATLLLPMHGHVNLIMINPVRERRFVRPTREAAQNFKIKLEKYGINVTIRREMGSDIDGACGQLRKRFAGGQKERTR